MGDNRNVHTYRVSSMNMTISMCWTQPSNQTLYIDHSKSLYVTQFCLWRKKSSLNPSSPIMSSKMLQNKQIYSLHPCFYPKIRVFDVLNKEKSKNHTLQKKPHRACKINNSPDYLTSTTSTIKPEKQKQNLQTKPTEALPKSQRFLYKKLPSIPPSQLLSLSKKNPLNQPIPPPTIPTIYNTIQAKNIS